MRKIIISVGLGILAAAPEPVCRAGTEQLTVSAQPAYSRIIKGYVDSVPTTISNVAPPGSDVGNYSVYFTYPGTTVGPGVGSVTVGNSVTYHYSYDSSEATAGPNTVAANLTDTATNVTTTSSAVVTVLNHAKPAFYSNNRVLPLPSAAPSFSEPPSVSPEQASATGGGSFSAAAPALFGDPPPGVPTDEIDLDSMIAIGDPEITFGFNSIDDLPPDDPAAGPVDQIHVDGTVPGVYHTEFELNYSDEQDLPGADAPGSEHGFFDVTATVSGTGNDETTSISIITPEPASAMLLAFAGLIILPRRRRG